MSLLPGRHVEGGVRSSGIAVERLAVDYYLRNLTIKLIGDRNVLRQVLLIALADADDVRIETGRPRHRDEEAVDVAQVAVAVAKDILRAAVVFEIARFGIRLLRLERQIADLLGARIQLAQLLFR